MSRKRSSLDNGMIRSFFGVLKIEMFYGYESDFKSIETLKQAIISIIIITNELK